MKRELFILVFLRAFVYTDYAIDMHNHDFYEVNIVLAGRGVHCIENGRIPVTRGDVFVIPPMVAHAYIDTDGLDVYHILLQKDFIRQNRAETEQVPGFLQLTEIEPFLRGNLSNMLFLHLGHSQMQLLQQDLDLLDDNGRYAWKTAFAMKYHTVWKVLYWFSALLNEQMQSSDRPKASRYEASVVRALEYIHRQYAETVCRKNHPRGSLPGGLHDLLHLFAPF